jgi:hypothetical protein
LLVSLGIYLGGRRTLPEDTSSWPCRPREQGRSRGRAAPARADRRLRAGRFLGRLRSAGNTIVLWAEDFTDRSVDLGSGGEKFRRPGFCAQPAP